VHYQLTQELSTHYDLSCEAPYHAGNVLMWLVRSFVSRSPDSGFEPDEVFLRFIEDNYGPELVHSNVVADAYWTIRRVLYSALPGYKDAVSTDTYIPTHQVGMDFFDHIILTVDPVTCQRLLCLPNALC
jgi:hypothetical protein